MPADYVFGLDMGLAEEDAAIFVDELNERGVSTGLPQALGGLPYDQLGVTGFGVAEVAHAAATATDLGLQSARVAIQGFGAVGEPRLPGWTSSVPTTHRSRSIRRPCSR